MGDSRLLTKQSVDIFTSAHIRQALFAPVQIERCIMKD